MTLHRIRRAPDELYGRVRLAATPRQRRFVFVFSHMRSYSSLLCHILHSNPAIAGYVEMHQGYTTSRDLHRLSVLTEKIADDKSQSPSFALDKILFNYPFTDTVLNRPDVFALFMLRDPESTIRSTLALGRRHGDGSWLTQPERVVEYYIDRLGRLEVLARRKRAQAFYFDADRLIDETEEVLTSISEFLELDTPLSPSYQTFEHTGQRGYGDSSDFIRSGQIVADRKNYSRLDVPDQLMTRARSAFDRTSDTLRRNWGHHPSDLQR